MRAMEIRKANEGDAAALLAIYKRYIDTTITFETELPTEEEFRGRIREFSSFFPYLVAEEDGKILGYAYAHKAFGRAAYRFSVETTIYMAPEACGTGLSEALYREMLGILEKQGAVNAYALVTGPNTRSIRFHERLGFKAFARFEDVGYKNGEWLDVVWLRAKLNEPRAEMPELVNWNSL